MTAFNEAKTLIGRLDSNSPVERQAARLALEVEAEHLLRELVALVEELKAMMRKQAS